MPGAICLTIRDSLRVRLVTCVPFGRPLGIDREGARHAHALATKPAILILIATQVVRAPFGEFEAFVVVP